MRNSTLGKEVLCLWENIIQSNISKRFCMDFYSRFDRTSDYIKHLKGLSWGILLVSESGKNSKILPNYYIPELSL